MVLEKNKGELRHLCLIKGMILSVHNNRNIDLY
ncbi:MAG: hypothetical protein CNLJKLNK_00741 [Holosporales bacterium]